MKYLDLHLVSVVLGYKHKKVSRLFMIPASHGGHDLPKDIATGFFFTFHFKIGCLKVLISKVLTCVAFAIV